MYGAIEVVKKDSCVFDLDSGACMCNLWIITNYLRSVALIFSHGDETMAAQC